MDFAKGFFSNGIATIIIHPLDVVKSRYQVNNSNTSINTIVSDIWKSNGIKGFYRGIIPNLSTYTVFWAVFFQSKNMNIHITDNVFLKSYIAGNLASTFTNPLFVLKTRLQVNNTNKNIIIKELYNNKSHLFKGLPSTYLNNLKLGIQFPLYDYIKNKTENIVFSSFTSKLLCSTVFYPLDLIRVNQRNSTKKTTIINISKNIYKSNGIKGFYRGVLLYNSVSIMNFTIMMSILECIK